MEIYKGRHRNYEWCRWVILKYPKEVQDGSIGPIPNNYLLQRTTAGIEKGSPPMTQVAQHWNLILPINIWQIKNHQERERNYKKQTCNSENTVKKFWFFYFSFPFSLPKHPKTILDFLIWDNKCSCRPIQRKNCKIKEKRDMGVTENHHLFLFSAAQWGNHAKFQFFCWPPFCSVLRLFH